MILSEDRPTFKAVNLTTWDMQTIYRQIRFEPSLQAFTAQRAELLVLLKPLAPEAQSRVATVIGIGRPRRRTWYMYALWLLNREKSHYRPIGNIVTTPRLDRWIVEK